MPQQSTVEVTGPLHARYDKILTPEALDFVAALHRDHEPRRQELLARRRDRHAAIAAGADLDFLEETRAVREGDWQVAPPAPGLIDRRVEITGPTDAKMAINALNSGARVWLAEPTVVPPGRKPARGRPTTTPRPTAKPVRVDEVVAGLPAGAWRRVTVAAGSQGPLIYDYAEVRVWFSEQRLPSGPERLLVRRSLGQEPEVKYHRTNAPPEVPLTAVAATRSKRWAIEQDFQNAKGECGLDEYETRGWVGWHHHTALSVLALWFLARQRDRSGGKNPGADGARGPGRPRVPARPAGVG